MLGHYPLWHELTSRVLAEAQINMHLHTQSQWLQRNTKRNILHNVEHCESVSRHIAEVNHNHFLCVYKYTQKVICICLHLCMWGWGGMLFTLRHKRGKPSIYQLQLCPYSPPWRHSETHFSQINNPPRDLRWRHHVGLLPWNASCKQEVGRMPTEATAYQNVKPMQLLNTIYKYITPIAKTYKVHLFVLFSLWNTHFFWWGTKCCFNKHCLVTPWRILS